MQTTGTNQNTAAGLILAGGVAAAVSAVLSWIDFTAPGRSDALKGTELTSGLVTVVLGVVVVVIGAVLFGSGGRSGRRGGPITAIVLAAIVLFIGAYAALAPEDALVQFESQDVADDLGISETEAKLALEEGFESGELEGSALVGTWVAAAGGLIALVGGIMGVVTAGKIRAAQRTPAPPPSEAAAPPPEP